MTVESGFGEGYDAQMNQHSSLFGTAIAHSYDWSSVRHVMDVGGGVGRTLAALLSEHPHLRGSLVDLPGPAAEAATLFEQAGVADRCTIVQQSFLDALPVGGDAYLVANVVHNWNDEGAASLLRRCAEAAVPGGKVLPWNPNGPDRLFHHDGRRMANGNKSTIQPIAHLHHNPVRPSHQIRRSVCNINKTLTAEHEHFF